MKKTYKKRKNAKKITKTIRRNRRIGCMRQMKGGARNLGDVPFGIITHQTMGDCIKELIEASFSIYEKLLRKGVPITIVCGGQSPSYYCLAMMNFKIYNPDLVNIVILPHSKQGQRAENQLAENIAYCTQLRKKGIDLRQNVVIIDGVHSGTGILALESALKHCFSGGLIITKIAINAVRGVSQIPVDEEIILQCEPKFSDVFPRLVTSYYPRDFHDESKFVTEFIGLSDNPIAQMIIEIAKSYPEIRVEDTDWFKLNNEITDLVRSEREKEKIMELKRAEVNELQYKIKREEYELRQKREREEHEKRKSAIGQSYEPIVLTNPKRYQCPICKNISGTALQLTHNFDCPNKHKTPKESTE
jgi:hypothetical protein